MATAFSWSVAIVPGGSAGNRTSGQGKTGLALPFAADGRGRLALVSGNDQLEKIIGLNLSDLDSSNPFQGDIGLGSDVVFAVASVKLRADLNRRINLLFRRLQLQDRARLSGRPEFTTDSATQELSVDIKYINLEENKAGQIGLKFSLSNATG